MASPFYFFIASRLKEDSSWTTDPKEMVHLSMSAEINKEYDLSGLKVICPTIMVKKFEKKWWNIFFIFVPTDSIVQSRTQK